MVAEVWLERQMLGQGKGMILKVEAANEGGLGRTSGGFGPAGDGLVAWPANRRRMAYVPGRWMLACTQGGKVDGLGYGAYDMRLGSRSRAANQRTQTTKKPRRLILRLSTTLVSPCTDREIFACGCILLPFFSCGSGILLRSIASHPSSPATVIFTG